MHYGITLSNIGFDAQTLAMLAHEAEAAGWDGAFVWDSIFGTDAWIALTAMALRTERIRLGPFVTPLARRRPWKLAAETATLDRLANGRLILPVGLGAEEDRWAQVEEEPNVRLKAKKLDEGLAVLTGLWSGRPLSFDGDYYHLHDVTLSVTPRQSPRIPIWVSGGWPRPPATQLRRMLRWDGVIFSSTADTQGLKEFLDGQRTTTTPFDLVTEGETPGNDRARAIEIVRPRTEAGFNWWLEAVWGTPESGGGLEGIRTRIRQGPPA
jgi:alkanesulfonate monooxygenase SsuD/methylene tetrahydromethanopterin reductase-like flavin-dependent oxidoreductase (luciferase family)